MKFFYLNKTPKSSMFVDNVENSFTYEWNQELEQGKCSKGVKKCFNISILDMNDMIQSEITTQSGKV